MKSHYSRIWDYIELVDERNKDLSIVNLLGINIEKIFMPSIANVSQTDLSKYKVIRDGYFSCNIMHVGRDEKLPIALYRNDEPSIVSPAYKVFKVKDSNDVLPEFLMIEFKRKEFDRYTWFICDSSIRGWLDWDRFCDIQLPIPSIEEQRLYVALYNSIDLNQKSHEKSLIDLQLICETYMENLKKTEKLKSLGDYIEQSDERNKNLETENLLGISIKKKFIKSRSDKTKLNLANYKTVRMNQFSYVTVTSRNGEKISIALQDKDIGLVSSTYIVFSIKDTGVLLPEFLLLWFKRDDFDRYARFNSWWSARETFDWDDMCRVELPIPDINEQEAIVAIHRVRKQRRDMNDKLKEMIQKLCPVLISWAVTSCIKK